MSYHLMFMMAPVTGCDKQFTRLYLTMVCKEINRKPRKCAVIGSKEMLIKRILLKRILILDGYVERIKLTCKLSRYFFGSCFLRSGIPCNNIKSYVTYRREMHVGWPQWKIISPRRYFHDVCHIILTYEVRQGEFVCWH